MLDRYSSWRLHFAQNAALITLSLLFLPLDTLILGIVYILQWFQSPNTARRRIRRSRGFRPKTILVTGVGMSKGLTLARTFYRAGHNVIGADFEPYDILACGRFSKAISKFYSLSYQQGPNGSSEYAQDLLEIIQKEKVDLWVSCSGVASAVEDGYAKEVIEQQSSCRAIQFNVDTTSTLHEKHTFIEHTARLGLPIPETHNVTSRDAVHKVLNVTKKKYILKSVGVDDAHRGDMTLLPRRTMSETYSHIAEVPISPTKPWVLQQFVQGKEYCTHSLVINGKVYAFLACPSAELLMHYELLSPESTLSRAMLHFTQIFAAKSGEGFTGHLSFDFLVDEVVTEKGVQLVLQPIECNPRAHTAVVLFHGRELEIAEGIHARPQASNERDFEEHRTRSCHSGGKSEILLDWTRCRRTVTIPNAATAPREDGNGGVPAAVHGILGTCAFLERWDIRDLGPIAVVVALSRLLAGSVLVVHLAAEEMESD